MVNDIDEVLRLEDIFTKQLETLEKQQEEIKNGKDHFAELYKAGHDLFSTQTGHRFLEIIQEFLNRPVSPAHLSERYACVREGHNEIIRMLLNMQKLQINPEK